MHVVDLPIEISPFARLGLTAAGRTTLETFIMVEDRQRLQRA
jgi:hypothetical protein